MILNMSHKKEVQWSLRVTTKAPRLTFPRLGLRRRLGKRSPGFHALAKRGKHGGRVEALRFKVCGVFLSGLRLQGLGFFEGRCKVCNPRYIAQPGWAGTWDC